MHQNRHQKEDKNIITRKMFRRRSHVGKENEGDDFKLRTRWKLSNDNRLTASSSNTSALLTLSSKFPVLSGARSTINSLEKHKIIVELLHQFKTFDLNKTALVYLTTSSQSRDSWKWWTCGVPLQTACRNTLLGKLGDKPHYHNCGSTLTWKNGRAFSSSLSRK